MLPVTVIKSLVLLIILGALLAGCSPQEQPYSSKNTWCEHPQSLDNQCLFDLSPGLAVWMVSDDPGMPIEQGVQLQLISNQPLQQVEGEIRGVSMYMGRLPVVWQAVDEAHWQADVYLGACTDPHMQWELRLKIKAADQTHDLQLPFTSYIPQ